MPETGKNSASSYFDKYIRNTNGVEQSFPTSLHIYLVIEVKIISEDDC